MMADTAMKFVGQQGKDAGEVLEMVTHLTSRFLAPTHHLLLDLKIRFIMMVPEQGEGCYTTIVRRL